MCTQNAEAVFGLLATLGQRGEAGIASALNGPVKHSGFGRLIDWCCPAGGEWEMTEKEKCAVFQKVEGKYADDTMLFCWLSTTTNDDPDPYANLKKKKKKKKKKKEYVPDL